MSPLTKAPKAVEGVQRDDLTRLRRRRSSYTMDLDLFLV